jgi:hypothetical protein
LPIPKILFNVYSEGYDHTNPIPHNSALADLGIGESYVFLVEPVLTVDTRFQFTYSRGRQEGVVSSYTMVGPNGDGSVLEYLERMTRQMAVVVARVAVPEVPVVTVTGPERMRVTDLPGLVLIGTRDQFDAERDTMQHFRGKSGELAAESVPYNLRRDVTLKMMFVSELMRGGGRGTSSTTSRRACRPTSSARWSCERERSTIRCVTF